MQYPPLHKPLTACLFSRHGGSNIFELRGGNDDRFDAASKYLQVDSRTFFEFTEVISEPPYCVGSFQLANKLQIDRVVTCALTRPTVVRTSTKVKASGLSATTWADGENPDSVMESERRPTMSKAAAVEIRGLARTRQWKARNRARTG
jgi:hypothetical protein